MNVYNSKQLGKVLVKQVIYPLIKEISKELVKIVQSEMDKASISTSTMQKYTTYELQRKTGGYTTTILVRDDLMQKEETVGTYGIFNRFMSLDMSTSYNGKSISWNLIRWLEETGARGGRGNNPIKPVGMFLKTYQQIETELPKLIKKFSTSYGVTIV